MHSTSIGHLNVDLIHHLLSALASSGEAYILTETCYRALTSIFALIKVVFKIVKWKLYDDADGTMASIRAGFI